MKDKKEQIIEEEVVEEITAENAIEVKPTSNVIRRETLDYATLMKASEMLSKSTILPAEYRNRPENCFIMLDLASRMGISVLTLAQNLNIINGKPALSGQLIEALLKSNGRFKNIQLHFVGTEGQDDYGAYVTGEMNGQLVKGALVTVEMAKKEGWARQNPSKWNNLTTLMLAYRAYTFFGRMYASDILLGLYCVDELEDIGGGTERQKAVNPFD